MNYSNRYPIHSEPLQTPTQVQPQDPLISVEVEIPESLYIAFKDFLGSRPDWDQPRVFAAALSLFLLQNKTGEASDRVVSKVYLDSLFKR